MILKNKQKMGILEGDAQPGDERRVRKPDPESAALRERLDWAVREEGGVPVIAGRSNIPQSTLYRFLRSGRVPGTALATLARVTKVSLEWLLTGDGAPRPEMSVAEGAALPLPYVPPPESASAMESRRLKLFTSVDIDRLAHAISTATALFQSRGAAPTWREVAQAVAIIYDLEDGTPAPAPGSQAGAVQER